MKQHSAHVCWLTILLSIACPLDMFAGGRRSSRSIHPLRFAVKTAIPSASEVKAVPRRTAGQSFVNPVEYLGYGLNLHPGARVVRAVAKSLVKE